MPGSTHAYDALIRTIESAGADAAKEIIGAMLRGEAERDDIGAAAERKAREICGEGKEIRELLERAVGAAIRNEMHAVGQALQRSAAGTPPQEARDAMDKPVDMNALSVRACKALLTLIPARPVLLKHVAALTDADYANAQNCGPTTVREIRRQLELKGTKTRNAKSSS